MCRLLQGLGEIAFCAVAANQQVRGFGTRLMNHTKAMARDRDGLTHFLTYADNNAVGYFTKQVWGTLTWYHICALSCPCAGEREGLKAWCLAGVRSLFAAATRPRTAGPAGGRAVLMCGRQGGAVCCALPGLLVCTAGLLLL